MKRPRRKTPTDPVEIIARAFCREDPDAETARGPLWQTYRKDAERAVKALGGRLIGDDWRPTAEAINALPEPLRRYIHDVETLCDPSYMIQENHELRTQVRQVEAMLLAERQESKKSRR